MSARRERRVKRARQFEHRRAKSRQKPLRGRKSYKGQVCTVRGTNAGFLEDMIGNVGEKMEEDLGVRL